MAGTNGLPLDGGLDAMTATAAGDGEGACGGLVSSSTSPVGAGVVSGVGDALGSDDGSTLAIVVGRAVGRAVGLAVGAAVGLAVGLAVGAGVGVGVGVGGITAAVIWYVADARDAGLMQPSMHFSAETVCSPTVFGAGAVPRAIVAAQLGEIGTSSPKGAPSQ
jgi:hypothetical protein